MAIKQVLMIVTAGFICAAASLSGALGATSGGQVISDNMPGFVKTAKLVGPTNSTKTIDVMIWLKLRNRAALDKLAGNLYDPKSPSYHNMDKAGRL